MGDSWEKLVVPAIAEDDDEYRNIGDSFFETRFPLEMLKRMRDNPETSLTYSTQYQQDPVNKQTQEFHEEFFRRYSELPDKK